MTEYIGIFYKRQRIQVRLGYLSPVAFERQFYEKGLIARPRQPTSNKWVSMNQYI
ncbi:IS3 family transposase [Candidatus Nitrotoga sp. AM1P]|uniref:IS3 family transposase n=1 Tax=Candidatus Nitrotoga sp. AM1P TaxID=2559597 RepID=UPI00403D5ECD